MKKHILLAVAAILTCSPAMAQKKDKKKKGNPAAAAEASKPGDKKATIASKTKNCVKIPGIFTLYRDSTNGQLFMAIKKEQLGKEYIHFTYTENGVSEIGMHKGEFRGSRIFKIKKYYENIEFEQQNTGFFFDSNSNLAKSANTNISTSMLALEKIIATNEKTGEYLVDADELFLTEKLHQIKPSPFPGMSPRAFQLGGMNKSKNRYERVKNYPQNMDLVVKYTFDNPYPSNGGGDDITDARSVSVVVQHSLIQMPENNFKPRFDDPRIGFFSEQANDMTTTKPLNFYDMIHRWDLQKKNPTAANSEPIKPITWWIENTTPKEYRATIKAAALEWNKAFEPLGFVNAVQVFEQSDTATWDAGDIRYNVLRWTSSPNPPFGGYGPSFVNPRTGEILGADIMFEFVFITNRINAEKLFEKTGIGANNYCEAGNYLHMETLTGMEMLKAAGADEVEMTKLIQQSLYYLILHEMGHTMGLQHNMKASQLLNLNELKQSAGKSILGSVMDYPALNINKAKGVEFQPEVQYCQATPGPYDLWAIDFGYSIADPDVDREHDRLARILARSNEPQLTFGNDADDMRSPGKAIDPRVMINDLSSDAIGYGVERIELVQNLMKGIQVRYGKSGQSYQEMKNAFNILSGNYSTMVGVISRYIGGVYVERVAPESGKQVAPYTPVPYEIQKNAMAVLVKYAFAPNAMEAPSELLPYLQSQRRGYNFFGGTEDPKLHDRVENMQMGVLVHVLSEPVMQRLTDSREYGNKYGVGEMLTDLTDGVFAADLAGNVNSHRQILQINYVRFLTSISGLKGPSGYDVISQARATAQLQDIQKKMKAAIAGDKDTKDHRAYIVEIIKKAFKD